MSISHDGFHRRLKPVQELLKVHFHFRIHGFQKARKIFPTTHLWRYAVGYGGEPYLSRWLWLWADESEPLFGDDEADENIGGFWSQKLAQIHHSVDVAATWIRHSHQVEDGWLRLFCFCKIHFDGNWWDWGKVIQTKLLQSNPSKMDWSGE